MFEGLNNLSIDKTYYGPDQLPPIILFQCHYALAYPLYLLFYKYLSDGIFPQPWKSSFVLPIYKSNNRASVNNYRLISKLSTESKLFEKLLEPKLSKLFNKCAAWFSFSEIDIY